MPRSKDKRPPVRRPEEDGEVPELAGLEPAAAERQARVVPQVGADKLQRYESPPDADVFTIGNEDYGRLSDFLQALTDRDRYALSIWRCDPRHPSNKRGWGYLPPPLPVPEGTLEEAVAEQHGPGVYRWQLQRDGRYLGADSMPPSLRGAKLSGFIKIEGVPRSEEEASDRATMLMPPPPDGNAELLRELLAQQREDAKSSRSEVAEILRATTESFKVQMMGMVESAKTQNSFLQSQLEHQRQEAKERTSEKDSMWKEIIALVKDLRSDGEGRSTTDRLLDVVPGIINQLNGAGLFQARVPGRHPAPVTPAPALPLPAAPAGAPPTAAEEAQAAARPMAEPTEEEKGNPMFQYIAKLVNQLHKCYQAGLNPKLAAEALAEIGTEENFNWLLDQEPATVVSTVDSLHKRFVGGAAHEQLLKYTAAVFQALQDAYPAEPDTPAAAPVSAPPEPAEPPPPPPVTP